LGTSLVFSAGAHPPHPHHTLASDHHGLKDMLLLWRHAGYSIWTNHNYKAPLLASAVACLIGNLAYCLSYDMGAVWLLFVARLITGFGGHPSSPSTPLPWQVAVGLYPKEGASHPLEYGFRGGGLGAVTGRVANPALCTAQVLH
jgi:MFS family permease